MMSNNLDPFTQKLLQRTQERKEARLKMQHLSSSASPTASPSKASTADQGNPCAESIRVPLMERLDNQDAEQTPSNVESAGIKRQSSEALKNAPLSPLQKVTVKSTSIEDSPKHSLPKSRLASRLNMLNQQYAEQLQLDSEENQRQKESHMILSERKKADDAKRAKEIQERIFGKNHFKNKEESTISCSKQIPKKTISDSVIPKQQSPAKVTGLKSGIRTDSFRNAIMGVADNGDTCRSKDEVQVSSSLEIPLNQPTMKEVTAKFIEEKPQIKPKPVSATERIADSGNTETQVVSVKAKMSLFEEKVQHETAARLKEKEAEEWLLMKSSKKSGTAAASATPCGDVDVKGKKTTSKSSVIIEKYEDGVFEKTVTDINAVKEEDVKGQKDASVEVIHFRSHITPSKSVSCDIMETPAESNPTESCAVITPVKSLPSMLETPIKNYTGVSSPQPVDCTEDTMCDTQLDVTCSMLEPAAPLAQPIVMPPKVASPQCYLKNERLKSTRCSTMKVEPAHLAMLKPLPELNMTPIAIENETSEDEVLSDFAKAIKGKVKDLKSSEQKQRLDEIDAKTQALRNLPSEDKIDEGLSKDDNDGKAKCDLPEKKKSKDKKHPAKPPRASKRNVDEAIDTQVPATIKSPKERHYSADDQANIISKPEKYSRKKLRKSSSFSEGQSGTPVKSGYHREMSEKYNACASFDKPDLVVSKKMQIQNLLEEAASQQNIVLQASQALNVAECNNADKNTPEVVEGERLLLLATERRTICLEEVKILKESGDLLPSQSESGEPSAVPPCTATLALTEVKLPLHRDFLNSLRNRKADLGAFHFIMMVSTNYKNIHSTKVVSCYDEIDDGALNFKSNILMKNVPHDFTLTMKVFGMHTNKCNDQIAKVKKGTGNQSSPGNLKNLFSKKAKEEEQVFIASPQTVFRTSNFKLVGECKVKLSMFGNGVTKYVLTKVPSNCPIEGCIQLRANCKPEFSANVSGFLTILEDVGGYTAWNRRWCILKDDRIMYWRYPDDAKDKDPMGNIDLRYCCDKIVKLLPRDICARPHTFELNLRRAAQPTDCADLITTIDGKITKIKYWVCCDNKEDRVTWMDIFNKQLSDSKAWRLKKVSPKSPCSVHHV